MCLEHRLKQIQSFLHSLFGLLGLCLFTLGEPISVSWDFQVALWGGPIGKGWWPMKSSGFCQQRHERVWESWWLTPSPANILCETPGETPEPGLLRENTSEPLIYKTNTFLVFYAPLSGSNLLEVANYCKVISPLWNSKKKELSGRLKENFINSVSVYRQNTQSGPSLQRKVHLAQGQSCAVSLSLVITLYQTVPTAECA